MPAIVLRGSLRSTSASKRGEYDVMMKSEGHPFVLPPAMPPRVLPCLIAGAGLAPGVALVCALVARPDLTATIQRPDAARVETIWRSVAAPDWPPAPTKVATFFESAGRLTSSRRFDSFGAATDLLLSADLTLQEHLVLHRESGWPLRCLRGTVHATPASPSAIVAGGIVVPHEDAARVLPARTRASRAPALVGLRFVPLRPASGALVMNAAFFAGWTWVLALLLGDIRGRMRRRRGRCAGYLLHGLGRCPECGMAAGGRTGRPPGTVARTIGN
jgi:hypothetical protein